MSGLNHRNSATWSRIFPRSSAPPFHYATASAVGLNTLMEACRQEGRDEAAGDGWLAHDGGHNPAPGKVIEAILRSGRKILAPADGFRWQHLDAAGDVVRWRDSSSANDAAPPAVPTFAEFWSRRHPDHPFHGKYGEQFDITVARDLKTIAAYMNEVVGPAIAAKHGAV